MKPGLTNQERTEIVDEAIRLITLPHTFIQGEWKCPVFEVPKTGERFSVATEDESGHRINTASVPSNAVQARDKSGRPVFAYCIQGAINQAAINKLGDKRAIELGAADGTRRYGELEPSHEPYFPDHLSLNDLAAIMYADKFGVDPKAIQEYGWEELIGDSEPPIQWLNDEGGGGPDIRSADEEKRVKRERAHQSVLRVLRRKAKQLRRES